jgi:hypothetical protein
MTRTLQFSHEGGNECVVIRQVVTRRVLSFGHPVRPQAVPALRSDGGPASATRRGRKYFVMPLKRFWIIRIEAPRSDQARRRGMRGGPAIWLTEFGMRIGMWGKDHSKNSDESRIPVRPPGWDRACLLRMPRLLGKRRPPRMGFPAEQGPGIPDPFPDVLDDHIQTGNDQQRN